jgi:hypothetical protein
VTSHLDIAPTLVSLTNASPEKKAAITRHLRGKDLSSLFSAPETASNTAVRDGALYGYNMFAYIDDAFMEKAVEGLRQPDGKARLKEAAKAGTMRPDLTKRGAIRAVFDGRYRFARYFSPRQLTAMNAKLNALIEREVGEDVGQMLPGGVDGGRVVTDAVYDV